MAKEVNDHLSAGVAAPVIASLEIENVLVCGTDPCKAHIPMD